MKTFDDFWKDSVDCGLIKKDDPNIESIKRYVKHGFTGALVMPLESECEERDAHEERMATDPGYKTRFEELGFNKNDKISVIMEVIDPFKMHELIKTMLDLDGPLVAGCRVLRIDPKDYSVKYRAMKDGLKRLLKDS